MTTERDLIQRLSKRLEHLQFYTPVYDLPSQSALIAEAHAYLDQPEPEGPTDEELSTMLYYEFTTSTGHGESSDPIGFALAVRARWPLAAVEPVPVSERLPGPEDCMDEGWAWFYTPRGDWIKAVLPVSPAYTHWLPHYALPVPTTTTTETP